MTTSLQNIIKILFYINLLPVILVASSCDLKFSNPEWINEWRLLLTHDNNNQYQLLRERSIPVNKQLYMVCGSTPLLITAKCKKNHKFDQELPVKEKCHENYSIQPTRISQEVSYCQYTLYKIGYNMKIGSNTQFHETYQVCFDHKHMRPVFTISKAYPVAGGRPDFLQFNPDDIFYGKFFQAYSRSSTFQRFQQLLGDKQKYMSRTNVNHIIDRGHLSPSADFASTNLKKSTFNMINVIPQFKTIDNGNWRLIEEWARDKSRTPANICTGVLDCDLNSKKLADLNCILQLKNVEREMVPMFLADDRKIPIPLWSYKVVKISTNDHTVFLTNNNIYHKGVVKPPADVCIEIACPLKLPDTIKDGRTFCCAYNEFINRAVPMLKDLC